MFVWLNNCNVDVKDLDFPSSIVASGLQAQGCTLMLTVVFSILFQLSSVELSKRHFQIVSGLPEKMV
jgi:hypothetical protein